MIRLRALDSFINSLLMHYNISSELVTKAKKEGTQRTAPPLFLMWRKEPNPATYWLLTLFNWGFGCYEVPRAAIKRMCCCRWSEASSIWKHKQINRSKSPWKLSPISEFSVIKKLPSNRLTSNIHINNTSLFRKRSFDCCRAHELLRSCQRLPTTSKYYEHQVKSTGLILSWPTARGHFN